MQRRPRVRSPAERRGHARANLSEDFPISIKRSLAERKKREEEEVIDPRTLDFAKKQKLFEALSKTLGAPIKLQEGELRSRMENAYAKRRAVRKVIRCKGKDELPKRGSRQARGQSSWGGPCGCTVRRNYFGSAFLPAGRIRDHDQ